MCCQCVVLSVLKRGVSVRLGRNIKGFIPLVFLAQHHASKKKKVAEQLAVGDDVTCRVCLMAFELDWPKCNTCTCSV